MLQNEVFVLSVIFIQSWQAAPASWFLKVLNTGTWQIFTKRLWAETKVGIPRYLLVWLTGQYVPCNMNSLLKLWLNKINHTLCTRAAARVGTYLFIQQRTTVLTQTPHLCAPSQCREKPDSITGILNWVKLSAVGTCWSRLCQPICTKSVFTLWCIKSQNHLNLYLQERSWKEGDSSSWVQSCQSRRWDKNLHLYTELTMQSSLYWRFTDKIRYRDTLPSSLKLIL